MEMVEMMPGMSMQSKAKAKLGRRVNGRPPPGTTGMMEERTGMMVERTGTTTRITGETTGTLLDNGTRGKARLEKESQLAKVEKGTGSPGLHGLQKARKVVSRLAKVKARAKWKLMPKEIQL